MLSDGLGIIVPEDDAHDGALISAAVKLWRHAHGVSQRDLARRCGCSSTTISRIESGRARPEGHVLAALARTIDGPPPAEQPPADGDLTVTLTVPRHAAKPNAISCDLERQLYKQLVSRFGIEAAAKLLLDGPDARRRLQLRLGQLGLRVRELQASQREEVAA